MISESCSVYIVMQTLQASNRNDIIKEREKYFVDAKLFSRRTCPMPVYFPLLSLFLSFPAPIKSDFMWSILFRLSLTFFSSMYKDWNAKATRHLSNSFKRIPKVSRHMPKLTRRAFSSSSPSFELVKWVSDRFCCQFAFNWCVCVYTTWKRTKT